MRTNKKDLIIFTTILIFTCIIFFNFLNMHYATDTYNIINRGYKEYAVSYSLNDGRPVMSLITLLAQLVNMPINVYIITLTFLAILISCTSVMVLKKVVETYKKPKNFFYDILLTLICYVTIFNFMYLENLYFAECFVMSVSILVNIIAANILVEKNKKYILKSYLLVILGILFYQGTLSVFITMITLFSLIKTDIKTACKNIILGGIACIFAVIVNLTQIRVTGIIFNMHQIRMGSINNILIMIPNIIDILPSIIIYSNNLFPPFLFLFFSLFTIIIYNLEKNKNNINLDFFIIVIVSIFASFAPNLFTMAGFGTARMIFSIGAIVGYLYIIIYSKTDALEKNIIREILILIILIYCGITTINYANVINKHKKIEYLNKKECTTINTYLKKYEEENNIELKNIAICYDKEPTYFYKEINNYSSLCIRPLSVEWADDGSINYYTQRKLKEVKMPEEIYITNFKNKNWDELSQEQFIFVNDTVYYCIY